MPNALIPVIVVVIGFAINLLIQRNVTSRYNYRCDRCAATFSLAPGAAAIAPHKLGGAKYARCPNCGERSWAEPAPKA